MSPKPTKPEGFVGGADNEARTRYLNLGKVALYQMSYVRRPGAENEARTRDPNLGKVVLYH